MAEDPTVVVTGASRGIGKAIAAAFARQGYRVIGTATGDTGLQTIATDIGTEFPRTSAVTLDVTSDQSIDAFCERLASAGHGVDVLVNNAGITRDNLVLRMKDDDWEAVIAANLSAIFKLTRRLLKPMVKARQGRIITISSVVGASGNAGQANYAAAKAGIVGFSKSLAREVASRGVTVNVVSPGFIDTDMTASLAPSHRDKLLAQIPAGRLGRPDEIAAAVSFLASDAAAYITGETIHVNGGMHMV